MTATDIGVAAAVFLLGAIVIQLHRVGNLLDDLRDVGSSIFCEIAEMDEEEGVCNCEDCRAERGE